jgi:hypothetical protein
VSRVVYGCECVCLMRSAHETLHAFVREFECVCFVRWEALISMLACAAERRDAAPQLLSRRPLGGGWGAAGKGRRREGEG